MSQISTEYFQNRQFFPELTNATSQTKLKEGFTKC